MKQDNQPSRIRYIRGILCEHCFEFILRGVHLTRAGEAPDDNTSNPEAVWGHAPAREMNRVKASAEGGCWICNHLTSNALGDQSGDVCSSMAAFGNHNPLRVPEFVVRLFDHKKGAVVYCERFLLSTSKQRSESTEEHRQKAAVQTLAMGSLSKHGNGSVKASRNAYTQGGAMRRKSQCYLNGSPRGYGTMSFPEATSFSTWSFNGSQKAREWLEECDDNHAKCRAARQMFCTTSYPLRLLKVSTVTHGFLKLIHSSSLPLGVRYATLSHCWGRSKQGVLLRSRLNAYQQHICISSIPKTFREAVRICLELQLNYLWIDSLCIVQDDPVKWSQEAPCMAEIYTNSYVTLGATASSSDHGGLERPFNPCHAQSLAFTFVDTSGETRNVTVKKYDNFQQYVVNTRLNRRGWVLQERSRSPRLIHFATDQIYWECPTSIFAQFDLISSCLRRIRERTGGTEGTVMEWLDVGIEHVEEPTEAGAVQPIVFGRPAEATVLDKWAELMTEYTQCSLSYSSDKLMAISGLAKRVLSLTLWPDRDYLAGMWRKDLPRGLLWHTSRPLKTEKFKGIPSWSWASVDGHNTTRFQNESSADWYQLHQDKVEILDVSEVRINARFASLVDGVIRLRGGFCRIKLWESDLSTAVEGKVLGQRKSINLAEYLLVSFDLVEGQPSGVFRRSVFFLPVVHSTFILNRPNPGDASHCLTGLLIEPTSRKAGQFRRVGKMSLFKEDVGKVQWAIADGGIKKNLYLERDSQGEYIIELV